MPPRGVQLIPRHPLGSPDNIDLATLRPAQKPSFSLNQYLIRPLPLPTPISLHLSPFCLVVDSNSTILRISIRTLHAPLNSRDEVKIAIECGGSRELVAAEVGGWIADTGALGPGLVATGAGKGACSGRASGAAVFWSVDVAVYNRPLSVIREEIEIWMIITKLCRVR